MTVQHHNAQVNGIRLHYVTDGVGQPMIFLHGFPDFWYLWKVYNHMHAYS
jgi:pimeloyl-ACP methyl ester carboxylesterase